MSESLERADVDAARVLTPNRPDARNALNFELVKDLAGGFGSREGR